MSLDALESRTLLSGVAVVPTVDHGAPVALIGHHGDHVRQTAKLDHKLHHGGALTPLQHVRRDHGVGGPARRMHHAAHATFVAVRSSGTIESVTGLGLTNSGFPQQGRSEPFGWPAGGYAWRFPFSLQAYCFRYFNNNVEAAATVDWQEYSNQSLTDASGVEHPPNIWIDQSSVTPRSAVFYNWDHRAKTQNDSVEFYDQPGMQIPYKNSDIFNARFVFDLQIDVKFTNGDGVTGIQAVIKIHFRVFNGAFVTPETSFSTTITRF